MKINFEITEDFVGCRIDKYLCDQMENITRNAIQKLIEQDKIFVNHKKIKSSYKVNLNDIIQVELEEAVPLDIIAEDIPLNILYEDNDLIVINKPQGMVVHPAPGHNTGTLVNALLYHCKGQLSGINGIMRPGIVHRIDKDTTGILVVAKNDISHNFLSEQLRDHSMTRKYVAIVLNKIQENFGRIDKPIGRDPKDRKKRAVTSKNSKHAITNYKVLCRYGKYTLVECVLETGRTHQIRVHMASIGHPVLGDDVYGNHKFKANLYGQLLHAQTLGFIHPTTKEYMEFEAPIPEHFKKIMNLIEV